jgi:hypothetical protein
MGGGSIQLEIVEAAVQQYKAAGRVKHAETGTELANKSIDIKDMIHTRGWQHLRTKLLQIANPYAAIMDDGTYDPVKLAHAQIAMKLLAWVESLATIADKQREDNNNE